MTDETRGVDDATLTRYLNGETDPAERMRVERWLAADPAHRAEFDLLRSAWELTAAENVDPEDDMWRWISARMHTPGGDVTADEDAFGRPARVRTPQTLWRWEDARRNRWSTRGIMALAAAVLVAAAGTLAVVREHRAAQRVAAASPAPMREVATRRGQRAVLDLADGSRVVLSAASTLRIPAAFGAAHASRNLYLDGEAYFEVAHDTTRPFHVITRSGIAEDVGTEFVVTTFPEMHGMRVVVADGVVAVHRPLHSTASVFGASADSVNTRPLLVLKKGDLALMDTAGTATLTRHVDVAHYISWTKGSLIFNGTPLRDALPQLERWYDFNIALADQSLGSRRLTATFRDEAPDEMLRLLAIALDLRVERRDSSITLHAVPRTSVQDRTTRS